MITFNLSVDFELGWGDLERTARDPGFYARVVAGLASTPGMLEVLHQHRVPSTWGVVGACCCGDRDELYASAPNAYRVVREPLEELIRSRPNHAEVLFSRATVERIARGQLVELASHGFLHLTPSQQLSSVLREDVSASVYALQRITGRSIDSFIPPRNCRWPDDAFVGTGIRYVRHTPAVIGYDYSDPRALARLLRLWNDFIAPVRESDAHGRRAQLVFLRIDRGAWLWREQLRQIRAILAGEQGALYCFTHPHNVDSPAMLRRLAQLCELVAEAWERGRLEHTKFFRELPDAPRASALAS